MTNKLANSVKSLASPCDNAIKAIAGERECPKCKGVGGYAGKWECPSCHGTGKVGYVWEPAVGEWVLWNGLALLISDVGHKAHSTVVEKILVWKNEEAHWFYLARIIPILDWETIEEILEGTNHYMFDIDKRYLGGFVHDFRCHIEGIDTKASINGYAKSRIEAVYKAVIELGKNLNE